MNVLDALLRIADGWKVSTEEKFNFHDLVSVKVGIVGTVYFEMRDGSRYRIHTNSCFVEKYHVWKGYKRL